MSKLIKNTFYYLVGNILSRLGAFLLLPLYTSHLSTEKFGVLELIYTTSAFLAILLGQGIAHTTIRFYFDPEDQVQRNKVVITSLIMSLAISTLGGIVVGLNAAGLSDIMFSTAEYAGLLRLALVILVFELSIEVLFAYIRARQRAIVYVFASTAKLFTQLTFSIYLVAYRGMGIEGVLISNLICVLMVWLILLIYVIRECGIQVDFANVRPMMRYLLPFASSSLLGVFLNLTDRYLINYYLGLDALGIYSLAIKFALILTFVLMLPIQKSFGPYRFEIMKLEHAGFVYSTLNIFVVAIASVMILGMSYYIEPVIILMSDESYHSAAAYVPLLLLGVLFHSMSYTFQTGILISKKTTVLTKITFFALATSVVLNFLLIPRYGLHGAATTFLVTSLLISSLTLFYSQRLFPVAYQHRPVILIITILVGLMIAGELLTRNLDLVISLFLKLLIVAAFSLVLLYLNRNDLLRLYRVISNPT